MEAIKENKGPTKHPQNQGRRHIRFKLSITGIELEATGYPPEELTPAVKVLTSKIIWFFLVIILSFVFTKIPDIINSIAQSGWLNRL